MGQKEGCKAMTLESLALQWLRYQRKCWIVTLERGICLGNPDVFGITAARYCIEIEIKRTVSDFRANAEKFHVSNREHYASQWPAFFYFLVPEKLQSNVEPLLPKWAGLMVAGGNEHWFPRVVVLAPRNAAAKKVAIKDVARLVTMQANTVVSLKSQLDMFTAKSCDEWPQGFSI